MKSNSVILMHFRNSFIVFILFFTQPLSSVIIKFSHYRYKIAAADAQHDPQFSDLILWHDLHRDSTYPETAEVQKKQIHMMLGYLQRRAQDGTVVNFFIEADPENPTAPLYNKDASCINELILHAIQNPKQPNSKYNFYDKRTNKERHYIHNPLATPMALLQENYVRAHEVAEKADLSQHLKYRLKQRIDATFGQRVAIVSGQGNLAALSRSNITDALDLHTDTLLTCKVLKRIQQPSITLVYGGSAHMFAVDAIVKGEADTVVQEDGIENVLELYGAPLSAVRARAPKQFAVQAMYAFIQHREQQRLLADQRAEMHAWMNEQQGPSWDADALLEHVWKEKQKTKPLETKRVNI